jgi:hypothetical protein
VVRRTLAGFVLVLLAGCGSPAHQAPTTSGSVDTRTTTQRAEDTFIGTTAAYMCNVQSTVYDDPKAIATAYGSTPPYPGLSAEQVAAYQQRLVMDTAFATRLTEQLKTSCHAKKG